ARLVLAVPVAPPETPAAFREEADEVVCLEMPAMLGAIGAYYRDFHQLSDAEVTDLLTGTAAAEGADPSGHRRRSPRPTKAEPPPAPKDLTATASSFGGSGKDAQTDQPCNDQR